MPVELTGTDDCFAEIFALRPEANLALRQRLNETTDQLDRTKKELVALQVKHEANQKELTIARSDRESVLLCSFGEKLITFVAQSSWSVKISLIFFDSFVRLWTTRKRNLTSRTRVSGQNCQNLKTGTPCSLSKSTVC